MLTNNKKRSFVKLIALTLAALMVFSVCLTGCTDEDARLAADAAKEAADKAQSSADAAQTAADGKTTTEAVAAQIAEALKPYLKADAALTEADVDKKVADLKAAIEASLKNYQAKGDYATKADVDKKQDKGNYATKDDLKNYPTKGDLAGYQTKGDYATKEDLKALSGFASSEELAELTAALTEFTEAALTEDAIAEIVTDALVDYATTVYVDEAIAAAIEAEKAITSETIAAAIEEALADYDLTVEERMGKMEADLKALIESYFGAFEPEQVVKLLENVDKAMDKTEWAAATVAVTRVLKKTKDLFAKVNANSYTQERKAEINAIMAKINGLDTHVVVFKTVTDSATGSGAYNEGSYLADFGYEMMHANGATINVPDATEKILSDLTVFILRAATYAEITGIEAAIDSAIAVKTFTDDITAWRNDLYAIGSEKAVMAKSANSIKWDTNAKWGANLGNGSKYHNSAIANNGVLKAQVVDASHESAFNTMRTRLEKLIVEYTLDALRFSANEGKNFGAYTESLKALYVYVNGNTTTYSWRTVGATTGEKWLGTSTSALTPGKGGAVGDKTSFVGIFAGIDSSKVPAGAKDATYAALQGRNWEPTLYGATDEWGYVMDGYHDNMFLDPMIKVDLFLDKYALNADDKLVALLNAYTPVTGGAIVPELSETYNAIEQMINDAKYANAYANTAFTGIPGKTSGTAADSNAAHDDPNQVANAPYFLWHVGHNYVKSHKSGNNYVCNCSLLTDDQYVAALKDYMVEWTEDEVHAPVPDSWEMPIWLSPVYDITGDIAPWNYTNADAAIQKQAMTIDVIFNYAYNINGEKYLPDSYDFITRYDLYLKLLDKAWELLYGKYKNFAAQVLLTMRNDFRVAAMSAVKSNGANGTTYTGSNTAAATDLKLELNTTDISKAWTQNFLENYYEGTNSYAWFVGNKVPKQIGPSHTFEGLDHYFEYNDLAEYAILANGEDKGTAKVNSDVIAALQASQLLIDIELDSVTYGPRDEILTDLENFKDDLSEFEWKKKNIGRVQDAFDAELAKAKANFEEIMYRYMHKEINDAYINFAYAAVNAFNANNEMNTVINPVAGDKYGLGVATYFDQNPLSTALTATEGDANKMASFLQVYVTGHTTVNAFGDSFQGYSYVADTREGRAGKFVACNLKPAVAYENGVEIAPAAVMNALNANVMAPTDYAVGKEIDYVATQKLAAAKEIYGNAINTMANAAVEYRFNDYIQHAKDAAYFAFLGFTAAAPNYDIRLKLDAAYNEAVNALTIVEYYTQRVDDPTAYLSTFVDLVLGQAIAYDSPYYNLIADNATYTSQLKAIKSSTAFKDGVAAGFAGDMSTSFADINWRVNNVKAEWVANNNDVADKNSNAFKYGGNVLVTIPQIPTHIIGVSGYKNYFATGTAVMNYDKALNGLAKADNGNTLGY